MEAWRDREFWPLLVEPESSLCTYPIPTDYCCVVVLVVSKCLFIHLKIQICQLFLLLQRPSGTFVHPSGVEKSLQECVTTFGTCHADKHGKQYRVWVDQVLPSQVGSDSWLVSFKKWELSGEYMLPHELVFHFALSFVVHAPKCHCISLHFFFLQSITCFSHIERLS